MSPRCRARHAWTFELRPETRTLQPVFRCHPPEFISEKDYLTLKVRLFDLADVSNALSDQAQDLLIGKDKQVLKFHLRDFAFAKSRVDKRSPFFHLVAFITILNLDEK